MLKVPTWHRQCLFESLLSFQGTHGCALKKFQFKTNILNDAEIIMLMTSAILVLSDVVICYDRL